MKTIVAFGVLSVEAFALESETVRFTYYTDETDNKHIAKTIALVITS